MVVLPCGRGIAGLAIGVTLFGERRVLGAIDYDYLPAEELKIGIVVGIGILTGLLVHLVPRLRRALRESTSRGMVPARQARGHA